MRSNYECGLIDREQCHGFTCCGVYCAQCVICANELTLAGHVPVGQCPCGKGTIRKPPMANVSIPNGRGVVVPREVVVEKVQAVLMRHPELISFDMLDEALEPIVLRLKCDPGPTHDQRNGWTGLVNEWYFGTYTMTDESSGELVTLPSLVLLATDGRILRLTNSEPAVRSWLSVLREVGVERVKKGLQVVCKLRPSQTAGKHYWQILPA